MFLTNQEHILALCVASTASAMLKQAEIQCVCAFSRNKMADCTDSHTMEEALYLRNGAVSEKSTQIFWPSLPVEYIHICMWHQFLDEQTLQLEVRCGLTDGQTGRQTHRHTDPTIVTLAAHAHWGLMNLQTCREMCHVCCACDAEYRYRHVYMVCIFYGFTQWQNVLYMHSQNAIAHMVFIL